MRDMSSLFAAHVKPGEHVVAPADTRLQQNALRAGSAVDIAALLANAENALGAIRGEFIRWLEQEAMRLGQLLDDYMADNSDTQKDMLYRALHDMRSNASAFGNALAGQIADHMCKLFDAANTAPSAIVEAHVRSIQAVVREGATSTNHPVGGIIIKELIRASATLTKANNDN